MSLSSGHSKAALLSRENLTRDFGFDVSGDADYFDVVRDPLNVGFRQSSAGCSRRGSGGGARPLAILVPVPLISPLFLVLKGTRHKTHDSLEE